MVVTDDGYERIGAYPEEPVAMSRSVGRGTMALEDGTGVDFAALRADRRERVLAAMAEAERRPAAARPPGQRPLRGRPPADLAGGGDRRGRRSAALRADGGVHLLHTTWDDGVPEEIPHENLSGLSWNPRVIVGDIAGHPRAWPTPGAWPPTACRRAWRCCWATSRRRPSWSTARP